MNQTGGGLDPVAHDGAKDEQRLDTRVIEEINVLSISRDSRGISDKQDEVTRACSKVDCPQKG